MDRSNLGKDSTIKIIFFLLIFSIMSVILVILRILYSSSIYYLFMIWNLILAWIPLGLSFAIKAIIDRNNILQPKLNRKEFDNKFVNTKLKKFALPTIFVFMLFAIWLLFFPNTLYIVTDLFHLNTSYYVEVPRWYDLILLMSFVWSGLLLGFMSLNIIHTIIHNYKGRIVGWISVALIILVSSLGIYIGRYERWNSWDVFLSPQELFVDIFTKIINPLTYPGIYGVTIVFSMFFFMSYVIYLNIRDNRILHQELKHKEISYRENTDKNLKAPKTISSGNIPTSAN